MILNQAYLWSLVGAACGTVLVVALRCLTLFIGLRLALRGAPKTDRLAIFREFARALSIKSPAEDPGAETRWGNSANTDWRTSRDRATRRYRR
jgi:hypothetical protein